MRLFRRIFVAHRAAAALLLACALLIKLVVPAGYMPVVEHGSIAITLCSGTGAASAAGSMHGMAMPAGEHHEDRQDHGKAEAPCPFAGLSAPSLSSADPVLLAAAILFVLAAALGALTPLVAGPALRLRPPLRAPPARA